MAQNGPHGHQVNATASDDGHTAPPTTTVAFNLLMTRAGPYGNDDGGSSAGNNMDKNLIPDLNMEERSSAGGSQGKKEVAAADAENKAAAADGYGDEPNGNIILERERRKRKKVLFRALHDLMPHVPHKTDRVTLVGEAIQYIKYLEEKAAILGKRKLGQPLAAARGECSSSAFHLRAMPPQTVQGMAALYSPRAGWGSGVPVPPAAAAPALPGLSSLAFKTWLAPNVVLTVANNSGYISVCAPRCPNTLTMVLSVLDNHGINVINAQVSFDSVRTALLISAQVNGANNGTNRSAEEVYQRAVSEIIYRLHSNSS